MDYSISTRFKNAWNAFRNKDPSSFNNGMGFSVRPDRARLTRGNEKSITTSIYNRIALDVSSINIQHVRLDKNGRFKDIVDSKLNSCLTIEANIDQTNRAFIQDAVISMFDEGVVTIVPVDTTIDPKITDSYDIITMRTGKILEWYPEKVKVRVYNDRTGLKEDLIILKKNVAIIENPLYAVINEPNSTMQRLIRKLNLLDVIDEKSASNKLDLIFQLPYTVRTETKRAQAEKRRGDLEQQLAESKYGIGYIDSTERVIQLNRPVENNLMSQIEYLTSMLYSQLGINQGVLEGTADSKAMSNYYDRTIEPIVSAIVDEMKRKFISKTARTQGQSIMYFRDPFKLVPILDLAEMVDKFTRNEVMTSNEFRQVIGMKPSNDPNADKLLNKNLKQVDSGAIPTTSSEIDNEEEEIQNEV